MRTSRLPGPQRKIAPAPPGAPPSPGAWVPGGRHAPRPAAEDSTRPLGLPLLPGQVEPQYVHRRAALAGPQPGEAPDLGEAPVGPDGGVGPHRPRPAGAARAPA